MKLNETNPYIRFASPINYKSQNNPVKVTDCRIFYITKGYADILKKASAASAVAVTKNGAAPSIPYSVEVQKFIESYQEA